MAEKKEFNPSAYRDLRIIPARGSFGISGFKLPDFGISETLTRFAGKQPDKVFVGSGFNARPYKIDPEAIVDTKDQATLFDEKGEYIGGVLPVGNKPVKINEDEMKDLDLDTGPAVSDELPNKAVEFAKDYAERVLLGRQIDNRVLQRSQNLINQQTAALSERNRQALANQLAFTKFDTTQIAKNQLRAAQREATLMDAVARQTDAARLASAQGINPRGRAGGA